MLDYNEVDKITKKILNTIKKIENKGTNYYKLDDIDALNLESFQNDIRIRDFAAEDSGYITGTIGPFSYIYLRTVAITSDGAIRKFSNIYLSDAQFLERKKISDIAEILSRISEYYIVWDLVEDQDLVLFDGSLIADIVSSSASILNFMSIEDAKSTMNEEINKEDLVKVLENTYLDDKFVRVIYVIYPVIIKKFLDNFAPKLLYFVKRPIHSRTISRKLGVNVSDLILLLEKYRDLPFITRIYEEILENELFGKVPVKVMYYRILKGGHIYKIEGLNDITKAINIIKNYSTVEGYPKLLLYAHSLSNVGVNDKNLVENILYKFLPKGYGSKEITKFV